MANITILQPSDYLKDSRSIINTNFANLNAAVSALSGGANLNSYNISVSSGGTAFGIPNDRLTVKAAHLDFKTTNPQLNGNITLSANNGYVIVETRGPGAVIRDNIQETIFGGSWVTFERVNALSGENINEGPVYVIADAPKWPRSDSTNEGLQFYGNRKDSSIAITSFTGYKNSIPGVYIPSVSSALTYGSKVELIGPNGALTKKITIGNQPLYGAPDNLNTNLSANNLVIYPEANSNIGITYQSIVLSAFDAFKTIASNYIIGTSNPTQNGNITLSANNGYVIIDSRGPGAVIKDNLQETVFGGSWLTFERYNALSGENINQGPVYVIADAPQWPRAGESNEGLQFYGNRKDTSIAITSFTGYNNKIPGVYVPSLSSATNYSSKVELVGPHGALSRKLTVGNQPFYGAPDNLNTAASANNIIIYPELNAGIGVTDQAMTLSAFDAFRTVASHYIIGTSNPTHNGNIALSGNNGYVQVNTRGPGLQLIDDVQGTAYGGTWLEFYRINGYPGVSAGTRYTIGDRPWWPRFGNDDNEGLVMYGMLSSTSIAITSAPGYNDLIPGIYVPSRLQTLSGYKIELLGQNGILTRKVTVGNEEIYEFGVTPVSSANVTTFLDASTRTIITSAHENTTSITLQAGSLGKINLKSGGNGVGNEKNRYISVEGRTINVVTPNGGPAQLQINSNAPGNAGLFLIQDPVETYGYNLRPYGLIYPTSTAGSGTEYGRGLTIVSQEANLNLFTTNTSAFSATSIKLSPDNDGSVSVTLLSSLNSASTSAIGLRMFRDEETFVMDVNPDVWDEVGIGYADFRLQNSSKSYGVQIPQLQTDHIHNYNNGSITISARDTGHIILAPASSTEHVWIKEGNLKFPDDTIQTSAGIILANTYPPSASTAPGTTRTLIVSSGTAYLCTSTNTWVKWAVDTSW